MSNLSTDPATFQMASTETLPLTVDFTKWLAEGVDTAATISTATATLTNLATTEAYAAGLGSLTTTDTTVTQQVKALAAGSRYRLAITIVDSAGRTWTSETTIVAVF